MPLRHGFPLLAASYVAGVALADRAWPEMGAGAFGALGLAAALLAACFAGVPRARGALAGVLAFAAGGASLAWRLQEADRATPLASRELTLEARICAAEGVGERRSLVLCGAAEVASPGRPSPEAQAPDLPSRLLAQYRSGSPEAETLAALPLGRRIRARARLSPLGGLRNPGRPEPGLAWRRRGIGARVRFVDPGLVAILRTGPRGARAEAWFISWLGRAGETRVSIATGLRRRTPGPDESGALLAALAVGDRDGVGPATRDAFARLGVSHLLAVSGLHVGLVAGLFYGLARWGLVRFGDRGWDWRSPGALASVVAASAYALLAGLSTSVQRALVFAWLGLAALALGRRPSGLDLLAGAAVLIGLFAPAAFFALGTQLSFAASGALLMARPEVREPGSAGQSPGARILGAGRGLVHLSAVALLATAPWLAVHGLPFGASGLVANLVAIPWTHFVLLPAALAAAAATGWGAPGGEGVVEIARGAAEMTLVGVHWAGEWLPNDPPRTGRPGVLVLGVSAGLAVLGCRLPRVEQVGLVALASVFWLQGAPRVAVYPGPPRLVMLDVGQGDALLLEDEIAAILVDAGRAIPGRVDLGRRAVLPALESLGVESLDVVMVTHADIDHRGGIPAVIEELPVGEVWLPWGGIAESAYAPVLAAARAQSVPVFETGAGAGPRVVGTMNVQMVWPPRVPGPGGSVPNARSLVAQIELAGWRLLLTGDIGAEEEAALVAGHHELSADVLKVPHHGSASSSSPGFLAAVAPSRLLLSAPCGGAAGLPHPGTLARLRATGAVMHWTGRDGAGVLSLAGGPNRAASKGDTVGSGRRFCPESAVAEPAAWRGPRPRP